MRGEDETFREMQGIAAGSPPHARGRLAGSHRLENNRRITPACAGKTAGQTAFSALKPDHPRMRGEDTVRVSDS